MTQSSFKLQPQARNVIMACGCTSHAKKKTADGYVPACIVHDCIEVAEQQPSLEGRTAFCAYGDHAEKPSSPDLPFFEYQGPESRYATAICRCKKTLSTHWPTWTARVRSVRRWFKIERYEEIKEFKAGLPDHAIDGGTEEISQLWAERQVDRWLNWTTDENTKIYEAELISLTKGPPLQPHDFEPQGPAIHDKYYCGCHGWD